MSPPRRKSGLQLLWALVYWLAQGHSYAFLISSPCPAHGTSYVSSFTTPLTVATDHSIDDTVDVGIWSFVEPGLGLTVICILTLRPLFIKFFHAACSTIKSDAMSITDLPARSVKALDPYHRANRVSIHGGRDMEDGRWTPLSDDGTSREDVQKKYNKAIRLTYEIRSVTDIDVVDVRSSRLTPPGSGPARAADYV